MSSLASSRNHVIAITGPAGAGKSTVAEKLTRKLGKCVNIDVDGIKQMISCGFSYELMPDGTKKWDYSEWPLVGESMGILAKNFQNKGFSVIINGYIDEDAWEHIEKQLKFTHKFLILPDLATTINRDKHRPDDRPMGENDVTEHHNYFSTSEFFKDFIRIDSTNDSVEQTVDKIKKEIKL